MKPWCWHCARVLLLAVLLGAGLSLSFGQVSAMSARMTIAAEAADWGSDGCDGCEGPGDYGADAMGCFPLCGSVCASATHGLLPGEPADLPWASRSAFHIARVLGNGHVSSPDHGPPKFIALG